MIITIGIPFVNNADTLAFAIRSVFAQTFSDWELILVDDGSSDGSLEIARMVDDSRVNVVSDGVNRGLVYRLNQITKLATGNYIARMDADDMMHPYRISKQVEYLNANPQVDVIGTATYVIDANNNLTGLRSLEANNSDERSVLKRSQFIHPSIAGRASWFISNPYDAMYVRAEDHELWCRTCKYSTFGKIAEPLHYYRENYLEPKIYLKHCLQAIKTDRLIYKTYAPMIVGWRQSIGMLAGSYVKSGLYYAATMLGAQGMLINHRNQALNNCEHKEALNAIELIMNTDVPGLL